MTFGTMDLSHLTDDEKKKILDVIQRDDQLREAEKKRVSGLKDEIKTLRLRGTIREGRNAMRSCARCREPFGLFFNTGGICPKCQHRVCHKCRESLVTGKWICVFCFRQMEFEAKSGNWFFSRFPRTMRDHTTNEIVPGAAIVRDAISSDADGSESDCDTEAMPATETPLLSFLSRMSKKYSASAYPVVASEPHRSFVGDVGSLGFQTKREGLRLIDVSTVSDGRIAPNGSAGMEYELPDCCVFPASESPPAAAAGDGDDASEMENCKHVDSDSRELKFYPAEFSSELSYGSRVGVGVDFPGKARTDELKIPSGDDGNFQDRLGTSEDSTQTTEDDSYSGRDSTCGRDENRQLYDSNDSAFEDDVDSQMILWNRRGDALECTFEGVPSSVSSDLKDFSLDAVVNVGVLDDSYPESTSTVTGESPKDVTPVVTDDSCEESALTVMGESPTELKPVFTGDSCNDSALTVTNESPQEAASGVMDDWSEESALTVMGESQRELKALFVDDSHNDSAPTVTNESPREFDRVISNESTDTVTGESSDELTPVITNDSCKQLVQTGAVDSPASHLISGINLKDSASTHLLESCDFSESQTVPAQHAIDEDLNDSSSLLNFNDSPMGFVVESTLGDSSVVVGTTVTTALPSVSDDIPDDLNTTGEYGCTTEFLQEGSNCSNDMKNDVLENSVNLVESDEQKTVSVSDENVEVDDDGEIRERTSDVLALSENVANEEIHVQVVESDEKAGDVAGNCSVVSPLNDTSYVTDLGNSTQVEAICNENIRDSHENIRDSHENINDSHENISNSRLSSTQNELDHTNSDCSVNNGCLGNGVTKNGDSVRSKVGALLAKYGRRVEYESPVEDNRNVTIENASFTDEQRVTFSNKDDLLSLKNRNSSLSSSMDSFNDNLVTDNFGLTDLRDSPKFPSNLSGSPFNHRALSDRYESVDLSVRTNNDFITSSTQSSSLKEPWNDLEDESASSVVSWDSENARELDGLGQAADYFDDEFEWDTMGLRKDLELNFSPDPDDSADFEFNENHEEVKLDVLRSMLSSSLSLPCVALQSSGSPPHSPDEGEATLVPSSNFINSSQSSNPRLRFRRVFSTSRNNEQDNAERDDDVLSVISEHTEPESDDDEFS